MKQKIQTLLSQLNHGLVDREGTFKTALLAVLAGENLVLIGPPGTGKSMIARRIANCLTNDSADHIDSSYFEYLLTKFSTPEEIFGPLSISELKQDRFKRNTKGYLPTVKMAFLDEIFKASSSILNALLTILNERIYHNGATPEHVPLRALIAASNELPTDQEELSALYDRFLVRSFVDYVNQDNLPRLFEKVGETPAVTKITVTDVVSIERAADSVTIPPDIVDAVLRIWMQHKETFKEDRRENLSDRRLKKVIKLLSVSAATNGRNQVDLSDVFLLKDCLWNHQENAIKVRDLILNILQSFSRSVQQSGVIAFSPSQNEIPTYELANDGRNLIPAHSETAVSTLVPPVISLSRAKLQTVVKGYQGSGTAQDPLLIQTVEDLMDLSRPEVGLGGYYFRQTTEIDCTALNHWPDIPFKGHYEGGMHTIKYKLFNNKPDSLFSSILPQSSINNINLESLMLAQSLEDCHIFHCQSNVNLAITASNCTIAACQTDETFFTHATACTITSCQAGKYLIGENASDCAISFCKATIRLICQTAVNCTIAKSQAGIGVADHAKNCRISDCLSVALNLKLVGNIGAIATKLTEGSIVERCFSEGTRLSAETQVRICGIAFTCDASTIRHCGVGIFEQPTSGKVTLFKRIVHTCNESATLEKNASADGNSGQDDQDGPDGRTVAAAMFKQRYFELSLGWDFDAVWLWDDKEDRPALRSLGIEAMRRNAKQTEQDVTMADLLIQQMQANIWL